MFINSLSELPIGSNERFMTLRLKLSKDQHAAITSISAPTLGSEEDTKETYDSQLNQILQSTPTIDKPILLGDFNAGVGRDH